MRCDTVRSALSADLDGEAHPARPEAVQAHLAGCPACRAWHAQAQRVTRGVRVQAVDVPDLTERILAAAGRAGVPLRPGRPRWAAPTRRLRWALGVLAALQLVLAVPDLIGASGHEAHAGREVAAFDVALAVGLLIVAAYPEHARVFAPVVLTLVLCFVAISALDVAQGAVSPARVAVHAIAAAQAGLVWLLSRAVRPRPVTPW